MSSDVIFLIVIQKDYATVGIPSGRKSKIAELSSYDTLTS